MAAAGLAGCAGPTESGPGGDAGGAGGDAGGDGADAAPADPAGTDGDDGAGAPDDANGTEGTNATGGADPGADGGAPPPDDLGVPAYPVAAMFNLSSPAFANATRIPAEHTCEGDNVSPPLTFDGVPADAQSLALVMHDPDAGDGFTHWVAWNLDPSTQSLPEGADLGLMGAVEGRNSIGELGYAGPCPPSGEHRYAFRAYALDATLQLEEGATMDELGAVMEGHVLAMGDLVGTYALSGG